MNEIAKSQFLELLGGNLQNDLNILEIETGIHSGDNLYKQPYRITTKTPSNKHYQSATSTKKKKI